MPEISEEELAKLKADAEEAAKLKSTNARLLEESEKNKKKAAEQEQKVLEAEKAKAEAEGDLSKQLELEKQERTKLAEKYKNTIGATMTEKLKNAVLSVAGDALDVDMILKVTEHKDLLKIDEDSLTVDGVKEFVEKVRESKPYLFGKKKMPSGNGDDKRKGAGGDDEELSEENYRKELAAVNTREEQRKVMKKYGKPIDSFMMHG